MQRKNKLRTYQGYDKFVPIVVLVIRGNIAADELIKEGFNSVTLEGGYSSWAQS